MYVLPQQRLLYLATPRTASRACERTLATFGGQKVGYDHFPITKVNNPHGWDGWTIVSTVRNHWDILVSWYYLRWWLDREYGANNVWHENFKVFVKKLVVSVPLHFAPHRIFFVHQPHCTRIMRYETLQQDFDDVLQSVGLPPTRLIRNNISHEREKRSYREYYDDELRDWVAKYFEDEIALYKYQFDEGIREN